MNIENLIVQITDSIRQRLGSKCNVSTTKVTKNNGIVKWIGVPGRRNSHLSNNLHR